MSGLPQNLKSECRKILLDCRELDDNENLQALFVDERIELWRYQLPQTSDRDSRVDLIISRLHDKYNTTGENALVLLLRVLADKVNPRDARYLERTRLADRLQQALRTASTDPERRVQIFMEGDFSSLSADLRTAAIAAFAAVIKVPLQAINIYSVSPGSIIFDIGIPLEAAQYLESLLQSNNAELHRLKIEKAVFRNESGGAEEWIVWKGYEQPRYIHHTSVSTNYKTESSQISNTLDQAKIGEVQHFMFVLHGPRGVGKSTLLQDIWDAYERVIPGSLIDVQRLDWANSDCALCQLLICIIGDIGYRLPARVVKLLPDYQDSKDGNYLTDCLFDLVQAAAEYEKATLLLLDNYDTMPARQKQDFETRILGALSRSHRVIVVLSSEFEEKFQYNFDLRMHSESFALSGLSPEAIGREFRDYTALALEINRLTGGLPGLVKALTELLGNLNIKDPEALRSNYDMVFQRYYRKIVPQTIEKYVRPHIRETLLILALLRRFDLRVLQSILPGALPDVYSGYSPFDYLNLIEELGNWAEWHSFRNGYVVNRAYQMVFSGYMWSRYPDRYKSVHQTAFTLYRELLQRDYQASYVAEMLYHRLTLSLFDQEYSWVMPQITLELDAFLKDINDGALAMITDEDVLVLHRTLIQDDDLGAHFRPKDIAVIVNKLYENSKGIPAPTELFKEISIPSN